MSLFEKLVRHFDHCTTSSYQLGPLVGDVLVMPLNSFAIFPWPASPGNVVTAFQTCFEITGIWSKHVIYSLPGNIINIALSTQENLPNLRPASHHVLHQRSFDVTLILGSVATPLRFKRDLCRLLGARVLLGEAMVKRVMIIRVLCFEDVVEQPQLGP